MNWDCILRAWKRRNDTWTYQKIIDIYRCTWQPFKGLKTAVTLLFVSLPKMNTLKCLSKSSHVVTSRPFVVLLAILNTLVSGLPAAKTWLSKVIFSAGTSPWRALPHFGKHLFLLLLIHSLQGVCLKASRTSSLLDGTLFFTRF